MAMYAVWSYNTAPFNFGVRSYDGARWTDLTANLHDFYDDTDQVVPQDLIVIDGQPIMLMYNPILGFGNGGVFIVRYNGHQWVKTWTGTGAGQLSGFLAHDGQIYAYGNYIPNDQSRQQFTFFRLTSDYTLTQVAHDDSNELGFNHAWRGCVIASPLDSNLLIIGDALNDVFGYFDLRERTFHRGSRPGGSCIFALGVDNDKTVWSGDYANLFYFSTNGGITFSDFIDGARQGFPEIWGMTQYRRTLYAVGCHPSSIIARSTNKHVPDGQLSDTWDIIYAGPDDGGGNGFMCCIQESTYGGRLMIGCGNEPFYYDATNGTGKVYAWDGARLNDISQGHYWGHGVYILAGTSGHLTSGPHFQQPVNFW